MLQYYDRFAADQNAADEASRTDDDVMVDEVTAKAPVAAVHSLQAELAQAEEDSTRRLTIGSSVFLASLAATVLHSSAIRARRRRVQHDVERTTNLT